MTNLTKEQLLEKDEAGLQDIAQQLNVKDIEGKSKENLIYDILDAQAEQTAGNETPVKRRTRIVKRNEADHIFSTNLTPAKNTESDAEEAASAKKQTSEKADEDAQPEAIIAPPKRKRGRPSKAEIAAREAAEAALKATEPATEKAEEEAIAVFAANLKDLLLAAPAGPKSVLGLDPGIRTGVKVAAIDHTGKLLDTATIYPFEPRRDVQGSLHTLMGLVAKHKIELIAIGNGTASRETEKLVAELLKAIPNAGVKKIVISEAGASVYSASELAAKEFPDLDVSLRGAVSIARRLQDPLAELVKIEPKAIGVGQYQHDVNQRELARSLDAVIEDCVNAVGVDVNTASAALLSRVSGLNTSLAKNIVDWRDSNGAFSTRRKLMDVPRFGAKAFEQAAGFLRINGGENPLDASAVHPEAYPVVERILAKIQQDVKAIMGQREALKGLSPGEFTDEKFGVPTVRDIFSELEKPGRDPRPEFKTATFKEGIESINDLTVGMVLEGVVTNVANFGAFVDIGVHQDGLVHISALSETFIKDPRDVVRVGQMVKVKVQEVDAPRKRIGLTMRLNDDSVPLKRGDGTGVSSGSGTNNSRPARRDGGDNRGGRGGRENRGGQDQASQGLGAMAAAFAKLKKWSYKVNLIDWIKK